MRHVDRDEFRPWNVKLSLCLITYRVFQKELYNGIPNVNVWRVLRKRLHLKADKLSIVERLKNYTAGECPCTHWIGGWVKIWLCKFQISCFCTKIKMSSYKATETRILSKIFSLHLWTDSQPFCSRIPRCNFSSFFNHKVFGVIKAIPVTGRRGL
jgi:hypothetical protein